MKTSFRQAFLIVATAAMAASAMAATQAPITGIFRLNKQDAPLKFATLRPGESYLNKDTVDVILSEREPVPTEVGPLLGRASRGDYGDAVALTFTRDGQVVACALVHRGNSSRPFNCLGKLRVKDLTFKEGGVRGKITSRGKVKTFDDVWKIDLSFWAESR
jgi:hypothetical protein